MTSLSIKENSEKYQRAEVCPVSMDAKQSHADSAILVIDMQNDFVLPGATLCVAGAWDTLPAIKRFIDYGHAEGWPVIYVCRAHHPGGIDAESFRRHLFALGKPFCVTGSDGALVVSQLAPLPSDIVITKQRFSAFFGTNLDIVLRGLGVKNLYLTGTQYPNCVRSTAVDAMSLDYNVTVVTDCCSAATEECARSNIFDLRNMGMQCIPSTDIIPPINCQS